MKSMKISHVRDQITGFLVFRFYSENMKSTNILMNVEEQNSRPVSLIMIFLELVVSLLLILVPAPDPHSWAASQSLGK